MIEVDVAPRRRRVAAIAIHGELSGVRVLRFVAPGAVGRNARPASVEVTRQAVRGHVASHEDKAGQAMIQRCLGPRLRRVAGLTFLSEAARVHVILAVARQTARRRRLERQSRVRSGMTRGARQILMTTDKAEGDRLVIERRPVMIDSVMTSEARLSEICQMLLRIDRIQLLVATEAGIRGELAQTARVTVHAAERSAGSHGRMRQ